MNDVKNLKKDLVKLGKFYLAQEDSLLCVLVRLMDKRPT